MTDFHDTRFPIDVAFGTSGGPQHSTQIVALGSGYEQRNQRWQSSRRRYDAGYGVKSLDGLHRVVAFFEARRGPLHAFRFRDPSDHKSCLPSQTLAASDQQIGTGDGLETQFQLIKKYGAEGQDYCRRITHPVDGTAKVAIAGEVQSAGADYLLDLGSGQITFNTPPPDGAPVTAGFEFDVPVRFDTDQLVVNLAAFSAGELPSIPLVEVRI